MWPFSKQNYTTVQPDSKEEDFQQDQDNEEPFGRSVVATSRKRLSFRLCFQLLLVTTNVLLFVFSVFNLWISQQRVLSRNGDPDLDYRRAYLNAELKKTSAFSPLFDQLDLEPSLRTFNGALRDNASIWRQPPSDAVDAAWDHISTEGLELITVSASAISKSGKNASMAVKAPVSWGEGSNTYIAQIDVFHQIHCLNELRKEMHYEHYYGSRPSTENELHRAHKAHCVHMLLQALMCTSDVGVISHNWVHNERIAEPKTRPMADFSLVKKCRNFDALLNWARERGVKDLGRKWTDLKYVDGMVIVPGDGYA